MLVCKVSKTQILELNKDYEKGQVIPDSLFISNQTLTRLMIGFLVKNFIFSIRNFQQSNKMLKPRGSGLGHRDFVH